MGFQALHVEVSMYIWFAKFGSKFMCTPSEKKIQTIGPRKTVRQVRGSLETV